MNDVEKRIVEILHDVVPDADSIELRAKVNDASYSIEFFETVKGTRRQCYDLVDAGEIKEKDLSKCFAKIATIIRNSEGYTSGIVNTMCFALGCTD